MKASLEQTATRYLRRWRPTLRPTSIRCKHDALYNLIGYLHQHHPDVQHFNQLQRSPHIEGWLEHLFYLKPSSRITVIRNLRLFFEDLTQWGWLQTPALGLLSNEDLPPEPLALPKPLPPEVDQALQELLCRTHTFPAMALLLLRLTGMRLGEMRALSVHALEGPDDGHFRLRVPLGKTHAERIIPLCPRAVSLVQDILAQRGARKPVPRRFARYMMVNHLGRHLHQQSYHYHLKLLIAEINTTERIYPHRLRHTFATEMARTGMPVPVLMKLLGHQTPKMTMRYVEVAGTDLRRAYDQALVQLQVMNVVETPALPAASMSLTPPAPDELPQLMEAVITRLERLRRDATSSPRHRDLHHLIKRMRRARDDLQKML